MAFSLQDCGVIRAPSASNCRTADLIEATDCSLKNNPVGCAVSRPFIVSTDAAVPGEIREKNLLPSMLNKSIFGERLTKYQRLNL